MVLTEESLRSNIEEGSGLPRRYTGNYYDMHKAIIFKSSEIISLASVKSGVPLITHASFTLKVCITSTYCIFIVMVLLLGVYYPAVGQNQLPVMVMEKMQLNLRGLVEKYNDILIPLNVKLSILHDVCCGLSYLHGRNPPIVHRDLTPNNILLGHDLGAKISDLGIAKVLSNDRPQATMTKLPGTVDFMPPECFQDKPNYGLPLDVFSYGGVVLYTITQQWPTPTSWFDSGEYLSESQRRKRYLDSMTGVAPDLKPLVISCLDNKPENRPKVDNIFTIIKVAKGGCSNSVTPAVEEQQQAQPQQQVCNKYSYCTYVRSTMHIRSTYIIDLHTYDGLC